MIWVGLIIGLMIGGIVGYLLAALMWTNSLDRDDDE